MDLNQELYKAQIKHLQIMLEKQLQKNLSFFSRKNPELAERFRNYQENEIILRLSEEGYLNLFNKKLNNKPVYSYDPQQFCQDYIDQFTEKPTFYKINNKKAKVVDEENVIHVSKANRVVDLLQERPFRPDKVPLEESTNLLQLNGVGLGYIIPQLLEKTDLKNLIVVEPHLDIFYACLHILDWEQVYEHFEKPYHSLKLIVGLNTAQTIESLRKHLNLIGVHCASVPYVLNHLSSPEMNEISKTFFERLGSYFSFAGYFDDEQVSLAHTIENWRNRTPPLREHALLKKEFLSYPVFVIGNGPSLDKEKDFLIENQDKAFIVSCGTAIGSLYKMGIKPDIHVEMERTRPVVEWLNISTDPEYRKGIILMALNTVHPDVYELFETRGMGLKANDLGTHFFSQYIPNNSYAVNLAYCNPTVGNAGIAFAIAIGFKDIYLFGLDLGFSNGQHHSTLSPHYNIKEEHIKSLHLYEEEDKGNKQYPANFGGTVTTTPVYISAKVSFEEILRISPHVKCHNTSEGILIQGAKPTRTSEIRISECIDNKYEIIHELFKRYFHTKSLKRLDKQKEIKKHFRDATATLREIRSIFKSNFTSWERAQEALTDQHRLILRLGLNKETQYIYSLLRGSIYNFNTALNKSLYYGKTREEGLDTFNQVREIYLEFLDSATKKIKEDLFKIDNKSRNLDSIVKS